TAAKNGNGRFTLAFTGCVYSQELGTSWTGTAGKSITAHTTGKFKKGRCMPIKAFGTCIGPRILYSDFCFLPCSATSWSRGYPHIEREGGCPSGLLPANAV